MLKEVTHLGKHPVEVNPHKSVNTRKGTILCNHLQLGDSPFSTMGPGIKKTLEKRKHKIVEVVTYEIPFQSKYTTLKLA